MQISISDEDIQYAERILGCCFDEERRIFIRDLSTLDLQAVPGSGKTTALLAKLIILESKMPFDHNAGVLVVSHTNAAVDEIRDRIGNIASKLFRYPNFVGTIQSFADEFLTVPYFTNRYNCSINRIDDEMYGELVKKYLKSCAPGACYLKKKNSPESILYSIRIPARGSNFEINGLKNKQSKSYISISRFKESSIENGILTYENAFELAGLYLDEYPKITNLLKKRFKYIFVDEMQDMTGAQRNILEKCFFNANGSLCYQRIGDENQSIYSENNASHGETEQSMAPREKKLDLSGSQRFSSNIANVVTDFSLNRKSVVGNRTNKDGSPIGIKPYLIVYDIKNISKVIEKYAEIIKKLKENRLLEDISNERYIVAGWRKSPVKEGNINISSYFGEFSVENSRDRADYESLEDYLFNFDNSVCDFYTISDNIINALLKVLRIENCKDRNDRFFTKRGMLDFLLQNEREYSIFRSNILLWCKKCIVGCQVEALDEIKRYIPEFLKLFSKEAEKSSEFIECDNIESRWQSNSSENVICLNGIKINIQTVHSIKGKTCTGILYLETYNGNGGAKKVYESEKLANYFLGKDIDNRGIQDYIKSALKVVYVGFSRPTHLLCFAVEKNRFDKNLKGINKEKWNIEII